MKHSLIKAAETLSRGRNHAYVNRVAWIDLEKLVKSVYNELKPIQLQVTEIGELYLTSNRDYPPFNKPNFSAINVINQIQVQAGWRQLNVYHIVNENGEDKAELLAERGATLWYSQDVTGSVVVFLAPYKSKAITVDEKNIVLARYSCPCEISARKIRKHFAIFFRYCAATSAHGSFSINDYFYRLYLRYNDFRYKNEMRANFFQRISQFFFLIITVIATLYAGNKI
ncbi:MAG: hypothetical protein JSR32_06225 [Proteobacteria bacterium]|nr:hypothetical protein [Pseudomonadota bacterium]